MDSELRESIDLAGFDQIGQTVGDFIGALMISDLDQFEAIRHVEEGSIVERTLS